MKYMLKFNDVKHLIHFIQKSSFWGSNLIFMSNSMYANGLNNLLIDIETIYWNLLFVHISYSRLYVDPTIASDGHI